MTPPRLVIDTNVLLSALVFQTGGAAWIRDAWQSYAITPLVNRETVTELLRVLGYPKFSLTEDEVQDLLADYLPWCETIAIPKEQPAVPACRDPYDTPFLTLCLTAKADALITGDRDLLALKQEFPIAILTLNEIRLHLGR